MLKTTLKIISVLILFASRGQGVNFQDINGNQYQEVQIGNQTWSNKNLESTSFQNGEKIKQAKTETEWRLAARYNEPAWCYLEFDAKNAKQYGKFYNWHAVFDRRGIAPKGWRIPSDIDCKELFLSIGNYKPGTTIQTIGNHSLQGCKLKSKDGWYKSDQGYRPNLNGTDDFGFCWRLSSMIDDQGRSYNPTSKPVHPITGFWTFKERYIGRGRSDEAYVLRFDNRGNERCISTIELVSFPKACGFPIRIIKNK